MDRSSAESGDSIAASTERATEPPSSANPTPGAAPSSPQDSPASPSQRTCEVFEENQRAEVRMMGTAQLTKGGGKPGQGYPAVLISSSAVSRARIFPSPGSEPDSPAPAPASSTSSCESQTSLFGPEGMSSLRTSPDSFHLSMGEISPSFSRRWPTSGFWTGPGECWTAVTSECHSEGGASSSLRDVLEDSVAPKYFLSPRAAAGILRRAEKRGKKLPEHLEAALRALIP